MVKRLITFLFLVSIYTSVKSQSVSVIKEYNDWKVATDMVISKTGFVYVCGNSGGEPMLIKLDTNGNEQWVKYYPQAKSGYSFTRMILDRNENIYLHANNSSYDRNFVCKLDSDGNQLWFNYSILGRSLSPVNAAINMVIHNDELSVIHNNRNMDNPPHDTLVISQFSTTDGSLINYVEMLDMIDKYIPRNSPPPFKNGKWVFSGFSGVLEVSPNGLYAYQELGDSIPSTLCTATKAGGYITYETKQFRKINGFEEWGTTLYWYDDFWNETNSIVIGSPSVSSIDTVSVSTNVLSKSYKKGLIAGGNIGFRNNSNDSANVWFAQINPDNGNTVWETLMPNTSGIVQISSNQGTIISRAALGLSQTGIRLYKIDLPNISYQTGFITSVKETVTLTNGQETSVFPNPSSGYFEINSNKIIKKVRIYTLNGILLFNYHVNNKRTRLKINQSGIYIIQIENNEGEINHRKLIIE